MSCTFCTRYSQTCMHGIYIEIVYIAKHANRARHSRSGLCCIHTAAMQSMNELFFPRGALTSSVTDSIHIPILLSFLHFFSSSFLFLSILCSSSFFPQLAHRQKKPIILNAPPPSPLPLSSFVFVSISQERGGKKDRTQSEEKGARYST